MLALAVCQLHVVLAAAVPAVQLARLQIAQPLAGAPKKE
jgi:hypothetical protein